VATDRSLALQPLEQLERKEADDDLQKAIRAIVDELTAREPGARLGADIEDVHKMRVATRRLRSLLRTARSALADPDRGGRLRDELRWLATLLGEVRDRDVLIEYLLAEIRTLEPGEAAACGGLLELFDGERADSRRELVTALDSDRYKVLVRDLRSFASEPVLREGETFSSAAASEYQRLRRAGISLGKDPSDDELHELRIRAKRARYAAEALGDEEKPISRFVERVKHLQDVLGEHQDAAIAEQRLRELVEALRGSGRTALAVGRLIERQRGRRLAGRAAWREAWKRLEQAGDKAFR